MPGDRSRQSVRVRIRGLTRRFLRFESVESRVKGHLWARYFVPVKSHELCYDAIRNDSITWPNVVSLDGREALA
jgi:hypothetical protein